MTELGKPKPAVQVKLPVHGGTVGVCRMAPFARIDLAPRLEQLQERAKEDNEAAKEFLQLMTQIAVDHCRQDDGKPVFVNVRDPKFIGFDPQDFGVILKAAIGAENEDDELDEAAVKQLRKKRQTKHRKKSKTRSSK